MSKIFGSLASRLLALFVIVLFVLGFRDSILSDSTISDAFNGLMETLPFAKLIVENVCRIMGYDYALVQMTADSVGTDIMKLLIMAFMQPIAVRILSRLFLRMPAMDVDAAESFMSAPSYRIKEILITILTAPLIAVVASIATTHIFDYFTNNFSAFTAGLFKILSMLFVGGISIIPLLGSVALGTIVAWRIVITVGSALINTLVTNAICLWIYISILSQQSAELFGAIFTLIVWLFLFDFVVNWLRRVIVGRV